MKKLAVFSMLLCAASYAQNETKAVVETTAAAAKAKEGQYNYFFYGERLAKCLSTFASNHGYKIAFGRSLSNQRLNEPVNGRFIVTDGATFMNDLGQQYGFNWFVYSGVLYVTGLKQVTERIEVDAANMADTKYHLEQSGLLNSKFGYAELARQNRIVVSGPEEYVELVKEQVKKLNVAAANQQFGVFRLKYANANDLQYTFNNQQIIIPGVATVLQGLTYGRGGSQGRAPNNATVREMIKNSLGGESMAALTGTDNSLENNGGNSGGGGPIIQADPRLNTIVVRDKSGNMSLYRDLIKELDVPAPLIQIEVMIVSLDQDLLNRKGINWWGSAPNGVSGGFGMANLTSGPNNNLALSYGQINPGQLIVTNMGTFATNLQYLENDKLAQTVAKPSLATSDNLPAMVSTTETISSTSMVGNNSNGNSSMGFTGIQIVHSLQITPHVIAGGPHQKNQIKLSVALQDGAISEFSNPMMPNYSQSFLNSQAVITEGQSIILAGYTRNSEVSEVKKVPVLGDIPLVGWFFKSQTTSNHKITTLYVVTPKIIWLDRMGGRINSMEIDGLKYNLKDEVKVESTPALSKAQPKSESQASTPTTPKNEETGASKNPESVPVEENAPRTEKNDDKVAPVELQPNVQIEETKKEAESA